MKCCVYTRLFLEGPYIDFFIEHYLMIGFDKIIILKTDKLEYLVPEEFKEYVDVHNVENFPDPKTVQVNQDKIDRKKFDWVLMVDVDELLILHNKSPTIKEYITRILQTVPSVNIINFRWLMIEQFYESLDSKLDNIVANFNKYENIHIKSMCKTNTLLDIIGCHHFRVESPVIYFENNILHDNVSMRDISPEFSYKDSALIHLHTRSIDNMIIKALNTLIQGKEIKNLKEFKVFVNNRLFSGMTSDTLKEHLYSIIGAKAMLPYAHAKEPVVHDISYLLIPSSKRVVIDIHKEKQIIEEMLNYHGINIENYNELRKAIHDANSDEFR